MEANEIIDHLPYKRPFLFVDEIHSVSEEGIIGSYRYREDESFYEGHFVGHPVTPGVILVETMAQIGLVSLGIFLLVLGGKAIPEQVAFASADVKFFKQVNPGEKVTVEAEKDLWRLGKLKCTVVMKNEAGEKVASGILTGMIR